MFEDTGLICYLFASENSSSVQLFNLNSSMQPHQKAEFVI